MRFIPTLVHGFFDYILGLLMICAPWLLHYHDDHVETWGPSIIIATMFTYDIFTDYETGLVKFLAMPAHLWFDFVCGFALMVAPWLFSFNEIPRAPYVCMTIGILIILNSLCTETLPSYAEKRGNN